jgi:predicted RNA-binding protein with PUA-like domain
MPWLLKTEPSTYSFADLQKSKSATWDGVTNPAALKNLRAMRAADRVLIYHTGNEKAVVGTARVTKAAYPDPRQKNEKLIVVDLQPLKPLARPVTLAEVKSDKSLAGWDLVRLPRLSVIPTSDAQYDHILKLAEQTEHRSA